MALIVLFFSCLVSSSYADDYDRALDHAARAFYKQSGLEAEINSRIKIVQNEAEKQAKRWIKENHLENEVALAGIVYKFYKDPQYVWYLPKNRSLTFKPDRVILSIGF